MNREERVKQMAINISPNEKSNIARPEWNVSQADITRVNHALEDSVRKNDEQRRAAYLSARDKVVGGISLL